VTRDQLLERLADLLAAQRRSHPLRVAVDGVDAAGKTTLADALAGVLARRGRPVIRASVDGFHQPRAMRYRQGPDSPEGYYDDSFDYPALRTHLLLPLGPGGDRQYRARVFDFHADVPDLAPLRTAPANAILLFDGVFLQRPELAGCWDCRIFVAVTFPLMLERAQARDAALFGSPAAVRARYVTRYIPGQEIYLRTVRPDEQADIVVDNNDPQQPQLRVRAGWAGDDGDQAGKSMSD